MAMSSTIFPKLSQSCKNIVVEVDAENNNARPAVAERQVSHLW
jgi:hypothetical protein